MSLSQLSFLKLSFLCALTVALRNMGGGFSSIAVVLLTFLLGLLAVLGIMSKEKIRIDVSLLLLVVYLIFNVLISQSPPIFKVEQRLLLFLIILIITSSLLQSTKLMQFRFSMFMYMLKFFVAISVLSFFCYFIGINRMVEFEVEEYYTEYRGSAGHFGGITDHSMTLGLISGISVCYLFYSYLTEKSKFLLFCLICSIGSLMFASSRVALGATMLSCLVLLYFQSRSKVIFFKFIIVSVVLLLISSPVWIGGLSGILAKNNSRGELEDFGGRMFQVEQRIGEFYDHPVKGIGFASVDINKSVVSDSGNVEPGPSWLTALSMTGIIGFFFLAIYFVRGFIFVKRKKDYVHESALLLGILTFFAIHMCIEGYVFAAGSTQCFALWLVLGVSNDYRHYSVTNIIKPSDETTCI